MNVKQLKQKAISGYWVRTKWACSGVLDGIIVDSEMNQCNEIKVYLVATKQLLHVCPDQIISIGNHVNCIDNGLD